MGGGALERTRVEVKLLLTRHGRETWSAYSDAVEVVVDEGHVRHHASPIGIPHLNHVLHVLSRDGFSFLVT